VNFAPWISIGKSQKKVLPLLQLVSVTCGKYHKAFRNNKFNRSRVKKLGNIKRNEKIRNPKLKIEGHTGFWI